MAITTAKELAQMCKKVATEYKTLYVLGCFGAPMTKSNKARWIKEQAYNARSERRAKIEAASADTFGFDCICLIKGLLWGWNGNAAANYGGAKYQSNGVPDIDESAMFSRCTEQSSDFTKIEIGEAVWMKGHIGIYIGDGLAVECTPAWKDSVQITSCNCTKAGYNRRDWTKHGKLPYVKYDAPKSMCNVSAQILTKGSKGDAVKALQLLLIGNGFSCGSYGADGDFGNGTLAAVKNYQKAHGLAVDGIVGSLTWASLLGA